MKPELKADKTQRPTGVAVQRLVSQPHRVQLSRKKGWKLPPNTVNCARPGRWGNPFKVSTGETNYFAVSCFNDMLREGKTPPFALANIREELAGKNLACWCKIGEPCHADVLLRLANVES